MEKYVFLIVLERRWLVQIFTKKYKSRSGAVIRKLFY